MKVERIVASEITIVNQYKNILRVISLIEYILT